MTIESTLEERENRYGSFEHHAAIAQELQDVMRFAPGNGWNNLAPDQKQALTVIADKIARMLNGEAFKAIWRTCTGRMGGAVKADNKALYNAEKVEFFGARMVRAAKRSEG